MANTKAAVAGVAAKTEKKGKGGLIVLIVIILILAGTTTMTVLDVAGLRSDVLVPFLRDLPLIGGLMPEAEETPPPVDPAALIAQLEAQIAALEGENASLEADLESLLEIALGLEQENEFLQEFQERHDEREAALAEFQRARAEEEPDAFMEFFATLNPDLAEEIFRDLSSLALQAERWQDYVSVWGAANPTLVAQAIEEMIFTDMALIVAALQDLPVPQRAAIINALSTDARAAVMRQMDPR